MSIQRSSPISIVRYGRSRLKTHHEYEELSCVRTSDCNQSFSPNLGSPSPPETPNSSHCISQIGQYLLLEPLEGDYVLGAVHLHSGEELVCKVFDIGRYQETLAAYFCLSAHESINQITEILLGEQRSYVFFEKSHGDMHSFVRTCKRLKEDEAARLFYQITSAVAHCHDNGVVLRDLKLRKFVFKDEERTQVKLESLEDACILNSENDALSDKHGCPAYVSPEILNTNGSYSETPFKAKVFQSQRMKAHNRASSIQPAEEKRNHCSWSSTIVGTKKKILNQFLKLQRRKNGEMKGNIYDRIQTKFVNEAI
ncbi:tribbles homolog 2-like isoform X4 [Narcine bancroftii]|uniref:tribbles homolog 2-like isoform X4 n=1 Tax=Narcine bancroftii TaxID=1343680 RepID=UPI0038322900